MTLVRLFPEDAEVKDDVLSTSSKVSDDGDEETEEELQAVAKHFGKELGELTLEALLKLEKKRPEEEEEEEEEEEGGVPRRKGPTLESILGRMPTASTLGLSESISTCIGHEKENGEFIWFGFTATGIRFIRCWFDLETRRTAFRANGDGGKTEQNLRSNVCWRLLMFTFDPKANLDS